MTLVPDEPLGTGDWPRGVAIDGDGNIYVGLRGGTQNVLKFAPEGTPLGSFTASIGGFGTGLIQFNDSGELIVAGDVSASSSVFRYDETGALIDSFNLSGFTNVVGLLVDGDFVYSAALFSGNVARYDLSGPVSGAPFITNAGQLNQPIGMTIGHTGNLFVANLRSPLIQEFDLATGAFIGTLLDIGTLGIPFVDDVLFAFDLHYDSPSGHYFLTVGTDSLIEFGPAGNLVATYSSPDLWGAYGFAIVASPTPEPSTWGLVAVGIAAVVWRRIGRRIGRLPSVLMRA